MRKLQQRKLAHCCVMEQVHQKERWVVQHCGWQEVHWSLQSWVSCAATNWCQEVFRHWLYFGAAEMWAFASSSSDMIAPLRKEFSTGALLDFSFLPAPRFSWMFSGRWPCAMFAASKASTPAWPHSFAGPCLCFAAGCCPRPFSCLRIVSRSSRPGFAGARHEASAGSWMRAHFHEMGTSQRDSMCRATKQSKMFHAGIEPATYGS